MNTEIAEKKQPGFSRSMQHEQRDLPWSKRIQEVESNRDFAKLVQVQNRKSSTEMKCGISQSETLSMEVFGGAWFNDGSQ